MNTMEPVPGNTSGPTSVSLNTPDMLLRPGDTGPHIETQVGVGYAQPGPLSNASTAPNMPAALNATTAPNALAAPDALAAPNASNASNASNTLNASNTSALTGFASPPSFANVAASMNPTVGPVPGPQVAVSHLITPAVGTAAPPTVQESHRAAQTSVTSKKGPGRQSWAKGSKLEFLESLKEQYKSAQTASAISGFLDELLCHWIYRHGYDLPLDEDLIGPLPNISSDDLKTIPGLDGVPPEVAVQRAEYLKSLRRVRWPKFFLSNY